MKHHIAIGNDELQDKPDAKAGMLVVCKICGKKHRLKQARDMQTKRLTNMLMFVTCGKQSYLKAVAGKLI